MVKKKKFIITFGECSSESLLKLAKQNQKKMSELEKKAKALTDNERRAIKKAENSNFLLTDTVEQFFK